MTDQKRVIVSIVCNHPAPKGASSREPYSGPPETILRFECDPSIREPSAFITGPARIISDGRRETPTSTNQFREIWRIANETGRMPTITRELRCPCGISPRVPDQRLQKVLRTAGGIGLFELELIDFERYGIH